jgi:hypothetical protein
MKDVQEKKEEKSKLNKYNLKLIKIFYRFKGI